MSQPRDGTVVEVDLDTVRAVLERAEQALEPDDHALLVGVVDTLVELTRQVQRKGSTIARLRRMFGLKSSEKTSDVCGTGDDDAETSDGDGGAGSNDDGADGSKSDDESGTDGKGGKGGKRKGHGRNPASAYDAEHIFVPHPQLSAGDTCPGCGNALVREMSEPSPVLRVFGNAPLTAKCWDCQRLRCNTCGDAFTATAPEEAQGPKYHESAASMMALLRYGTGVPLNRLDKLQSHLGVPVPASTQWQVTQQRVSALMPAYDALERLAADGRVVHNDDTSVRVLEYMGKRRAELLAAGELPAPDRTGLYTTAIVSITEAGPIALFCSGRKHAGENLAEVLGWRDGERAPPIHMCDALERNRPKNEEVVAATCLAHGRRHIVDEVESFPSECRHVLEQLGVVFDHEAKCKREGLSADERLRFHQRESAPVLSSLKAWMQAQLDEKRVEPNSGLGDAIRYLMKHWDELTLFLRVAGAPLDNNLCERVLKMAIRHRNNSLFYRSMRGARVGDVYMTLIHTATLHGENPFEYLTALMTHEKRVAEHPESWLPWTFRETLEEMQHAAAPAA